MPQIHKIGKEDLVIKLLFQNLCYSCIVSLLHGYLVLSILVKESLILKTGSWFPDCWFRVSFLLSAKSFIACAFQVPRVAVSFSPIFLLLLICNLKMEILYCHFIVVSGKQAIDTYVQFIILTVHY